jgi:DNA-directed RNA polymerase specialized sigma24 family protein
MEDKMNINSLLSDPNVVGIMNAVGSRYRSIDPDQLDSIKLNTLWECSKKYNPNRGTKFTSYLYQNLVFAFKNELKKNIREFPTETIELNTPAQATNTTDIFDGMPKEYANLLEQKYVYNMTMNEIGDKNGYSRETARRKVAKAVNFYKNNNKIEI